MRVKKHTSFEFPRLARKISHLLGNGYVCQIRVLIGGAPQ